MISIIIPTKNEEALIHKTISDLQDLRKNNLCEIIIVDGMSNDQTVKISEPYVDLITISKPNRGIQQNKGAMLASGDILVFLHADTTITKHHHWEVEAIRFAKFTFVVATCTYSSITSFCASAKESLSSRSTCVLSHPNAVFI